jgi:exocyst complex component 4
MLAGIRKQQEFTFDEYHVMLNFQCGLDPMGENKDPKDRNFSMYMIDLHGLELADSKT